MLTPEKRRQKWIKEEKAVISSNQVSIKLFNAQIINDETGVRSSPDFENSFMDMDVLPVDAEFEVRGLRIVKLFFKGLGHSQEVIML